MNSLHDEAVGETTDRGQRGLALGAVVGAEDLLRAATELLNRLGLEPAIVRVRLQRAREADRALDLGRVELGRGDQLSRQRKPDPLAQRTEPRLVQASLDQFPVGHLEPVALA
jgi:hypothetical protein